MGRRHQPESIGVALDMEYSGVFFTFVGVISCKVSLILSSCNPPEGYHEYIFFSGILITWLVDEQYIIQFSLFCDTCEKFMAVNFNCSLESLNVSNILYNAA